MPNRKEMVARENHLARTGSYAATRFLSESAGEQAPRTTVPQLKKTAGILLLAFVLWGIEWKVSAVHGEADGPILCEHPRDAAFTPPPPQSYFFPASEISLASHAAPPPENEPSQKTTPPSASMSFGSEAILQSCWSQEELEKEIPNKGASRPSDLNSLAPPQRLAPVCDLPPLHSEAHNSIRFVAPFQNQKVVALSFDLCESGKNPTGYDLQSVNYLRAQKIKATFFAGGKWMRSHPERTMQLMSDPYFEIGNHSWSHANLRMLTEAKMRNEILWTQAQYELLREDLQKRPCVERAGLQEMGKIPRVPIAFRFPFGRCSSEALQTLAQLGLPAIQWSIVTADADRHQSAEGIARTILREIRPGSIIICHANGNGYATSRALPLFIPKLRHIGYTFVTVSELLTFGPAHAERDCYELKPGDNGRYDRRHGAGVR